jgi:hypothetical protein
MIFSNDEKKRCYVMAKTIFTGEEIKELPYKKSLSFF